MIIKYKIPFKIISFSIITALFLILPYSLHAQSDKKFIRKGNREYEKDKFADSEISYRKATNKNNKEPDAIFNTGDALYRQNKFEDAGKQFTENINMNEDRNKKSSGFYNLGNSMLKANKFKESIEAYKQALKLNPGNIEAKYNLAYAQDMLKQQEQQKQQQQQQDKDKKDQQDKKDQDKQEQKDKQDQDQKDKQDQKNQQDQQQQQEQQQQQQEQGISKEDAERLLNAIANDEKNVQEKVKLDKAAKTKVRTTKNW